jgi:hypothetical protein
MLLNFCLSSNYNKAFLAAHCSTMYPLLTMSVGFFFLCDLCLARHSRILFLGGIGGKIPLFPVPVEVFVRGGPSGLI